MTNKTTNTTLAFALVTSLFFLWGFAHNLDPILIAHLRKSFTLTTTQSTFVDSAVFIAYFIMALPAGFIMKKFGYKIGIIAGLVLFSFGCFLFIPAADNQSYAFFLIALFILACGLTTLETAANPYAAALGPEETSTQRLNLAQSFNGLAASIAPAIGARLIFTEGYTEKQLAAMTESGRKAALAAQAGSVKGPYLILGLVLLAIAVAFALIRLPRISRTDEQGRSASIFHAFRHRHLTWAVIAQFFYVGAQLSVFSLFILFATRVVDINETKAADFLSFCGVAFLLGRFSGTFFMRYIKAQNLLATYALINAFLCIVAMTGDGMITIYAIIGICFFMSIMFPTIFALGIAGLDGDREYGSSLIVMSIVGGAVLPPLYGYISDATGNIQMGYIVPLLCFLIVFYFGWRGYRASSIGSSSSPI